MIPLLRKTVYSAIAGFLIVLFVGAAPAVAAASSTPGVPCAGNEPSALDEYCEDIPSATGGGEAGPGTAALSTTLAGRARRSLTAAPSPRRPGPAKAARRARMILLSLPSPTRSESLGSGPQPGVSGWSALQKLVAVVAAVGAAAILVGVVRRRRRTSAS